MIDATLKMPQNLKKVIKEISLSKSFICKGALGYVIGRTKINGPMQCFFISLCEQYEFDITDIENINEYLIPA